MNKLAFLDSVRQGIKGMIDKGYNAVNDAAKSLTKDNISPSTGLPEPGGLSLDQLGNKYHDNLVYGLAGTAVGGGIGALTTDTEEDKTFGDKLRHRLRNALTGGIAGGAVGIGGKTFFDDYINKPKLPEKKQSRAGALAKATDGAFGINDPNKDLTVAQIKAQAEAAATNASATPKQIAEAGKAAVDKATAAPSAWEESVAILTPWRGSEFGRTAMTGGLAYRVGGAINRVGGDIPNDNLRSSLKAQLDQLEKQHMTAPTPGAKGVDAVHAVPRVPGRAGIASPDGITPGTPGTHTQPRKPAQAAMPGVAEIPGQLRDPKLPSGSRQDVMFSRFRRNATIGEAHADMQRLLLSNKASARDFSRHLPQVRVAPTKGGKALQVLGAVASAIGANVFGKPHDEPKK